MRYVPDVCHGKRAVVPAIVETGERLFHYIGRDVQTVNSGSLFRDPGQDTVVLSLDTGQLYTCNETAAALLSAVDGERTFGEIVDLLAGEFEVSREQLRGDLDRLVDELIREHLLIGVS